MATSVQRARTFVADHLAMHQAAVDSDDVCLVASELTSNALLHARTPFTVFLSADAAGVSMTVKDGLATFVAPTMRSETLDESGRGLLITEELTDAWGMRPGAYGSKYVWTFFAHSGSMRPGLLPGRGWQEPGEPVAPLDGQRSPQPDPDC